MKPVPLLDLAPTSPFSNESRQLSMAMNINFPHSAKPPQNNLLVNSLASKLKQHRQHDSSNKENYFGFRKTKSQKRQVPHSHEEQRQMTAPPRSKSVSGTERNVSASSSLKSAKKLGKGEATSFDRRVDSASSDQLPKLSRKNALPFNPSRRSSSAGQVCGSVPLQSRLTSASSFFHSSESSGLVLESRGADYTIKVVKKDGVFQPIDKYASNRYLPRDTGPSERAVACDYELFTLPVSGEDTTIIKPDSRETHTDGSRRPLKVSWSKNMGIVTSEEIDTLESRMESVQPPATPNNFGRALSRSSFNRPVYSSGKCRVQSIGLQWKVPTAPPDDDDVKSIQPPKKPMWSWLVTPEAKQKRQKIVGQLKRGSENSSRGNLSRSHSNLDIKTQHSRDLHPVSTAMAREGTSVSKTKWLVPSSSTSTLEAERIVMDRLELVKRERKVRPDNINDTDDTYGNFLADEMEDNEHSDGQLDIARKPMDDTASYGTKSNVDTINSPTKSRSTQ